MTSVVPGQGITAAGEAFGEFKGVQGWEDWSISLHLKVVDGRARTVGIRSVEYVGDGVAPALTTRRLGTLPVQALADYSMKSVDFSFQPDLDLLRDRIGEADPVRSRDRRSVIPLQEFAQAWLSARLDPAVTNLNEHLAERLHIAVRTVANKANQAEEVGLIPSHYRSEKAGKPRTPKPSTAPRRGTDDK